MDGRATNRRVLRGRHCRVRLVLIELSLDLGDSSAQAEHLDKQIDAQPDEKEGEGTVGSQAPADHGTESDSSKNKKGSQ
jgi:hypothetical protein